MPQIKSPARNVNQPIAQIRSRLCPASAGQRRCLRLAATSLAILLCSCSAQAKSVVPLFQTVDLSIGEEVTVTVGGQEAIIKLNGLHEVRDKVMLAVAYTEVDITVNGRQQTITSGLYRLPFEIAGVQIDCPVTGNYKHDSGIDHWALRKDARIRIWPKGSPWLRPGSFVYPIGQKWFASHTWFSNEAVSRTNGRYYYHAGLDIGASEAQDAVFAATDGEVVSVAGQSADGLPKSAVQPRYDVVYLRDERGWLYRYSHLDSIRTSVRLGHHVKAGQQIGIAGKEGASGGWSHLHFEIKSLQPSGEWGTQDGYAFLWQSWHAQSSPSIVAVARPRHLAVPGQTVTLDGSRSWSQSKIKEYDWTFTDGQTASGAKTERLYTRPGTYSEILKVTDDAGNTDVDFAIVKVADPGSDGSGVPSLHPVYHPSLDLQPGTPITFKVRARNTTEGVDVWDFGDGAEPQTVQSNVDTAPHAPNGYAATVHRYTKPGRYVVSVRRETDAGTAIAHLYVNVEKPQ